MAKLDKTHLLVYFLVNIIYGYIISIKAILLLIAVSLHISNFYKQTSLRRSALKHIEKLVKGIYDRSIMDINSVCAICSSDLKDGEAIVFLPCHK
jgi:hypothetical protein